METKQSSKKQQRMAADERRAAILEAVIPIFAVKGFAGTKTKDLAKAAGVSEALLYRHFPGKESLYLEIQERICATQSSIHEYVLALNSSGDSLVRLVYLLFKILYETQQHDNKGNAVHRLMIQSMLEDGSFTKSFNQPRFEQMIPVLERCVDAAYTNGELEDENLNSHQRLWFSHHLAIAMRLSDLPVQPVFDYQSQPSERMVQAVRFCLRGMGLKKEVIDRTLIQSELDPEIDEVLAAAGMR